MRTLYLVKRLIFQEKLIYVIDTYNRTCIRYYLSQTEYS